MDAAEMNKPTPPLLQTHSIVKRYPGVLALDHVDFQLNDGEVHCLVGENGAGKTTLMHILSGAIAPDDGKILINGNEVHITSPRTAQGLRIGIIHQDQKLVPELTVAENIFLGNEPGLNPWPFIKTAEMHRMSRQWIAQIGENIAIDLPVRLLSTAQRQIVEIAKALSQQARIFILDEPTAPLTARETQTLFSLLKKLRSEGVGIIYISHRLEEIFEIGDRVTVLRDGKVVSTADIRDVGRPELIRWMVGRPLQEEFPVRRATLRKEVLRLEHVWSGNLKDISLTVHQGEILGLAGLVGAGRTELAGAIFGARRRDRGTMVFNKNEFNPRSPREAIDAGMGLLPEDRNRFGLIPEMNIRENISLANLQALASGFFLSPRKEHEAAVEYSQRLSIKPTDVSAPVQTLSGGNRQKVILARWLFTGSRLFLFDEPTAGIDVGAKHEIYEIMNQLAQDGCGILMISSELPELLGMCDRIMVMCEGAIAGVLSKEEATQEKILALATPPAKEASDAA